MSSGTERQVASVVIRASIEDVWRELTQTDRVNRALFNMQMHTDSMDPGGQMRMRSKNGKWTGVVGEILEWDPPRRFAHTFKFTNYDDPPCRVIFDLKEVDGGVELTLTAEDVPAGTKTAKQMKSGGRWIVNNMKSVVEKGDVSFGFRLLWGIFGLMAPLSPKSCLSTNWPMDQKVE